MVLLGTSIFKGIPLVEDSTLEVSTCTMLLLLSSTVTFGISLLVTNRAGKGLLGLEPTDLDRGTLPTPSGTSRLSCGNFILGAPRRGDFGDRGGDAGVVGAVIGFGVSLWILLIGFLADSFGDFSLIISCF